MTDFFNVALFATTFTTLIVILDPFGTIPVFLGLTSRMTPKGQKRAALQATAVSISVILTFAVLRFSVAMDLLMTWDSEEPDTGDERVNVALVPLGTPLLAGPGAIAAVMVSVAQANNSIASWIGLVCAVAVAHFVMWATMHFSLILSRLLGPGGIMLLTKIMGLLLAAIATELVMGGIFDFIAAT